MDVGLLLRVCLSHSLIIKLGVYIKNSGLSTLMALYPQKPSAIEALFHHISVYCCYRCTH